MANYDLPRSEIIQILEDAADLIDVYGHMKGQVGDFEHGFCISGALSVAASRAGITGMPVFLAVREVIKYRHIPRVVSWNDRPERTPGEVTDALRLTAKDLHNNT
jgi:hypothetical protein